MARFAIDTQLNLWRTYEVEADTMEEAVNKLEDKLDDMDFLDEHFAALDDKSQTDWLPENIDIIPYRMLDDDESHYPKV